MFGFVAVAAVVAIYFLGAELMDYADDDYYDDYDDADFVLEYHAAYLPFEPPRQSETSGSVSKLTPTQELPDDCRDAYFASGQLCYDTDIPSMDVLWTWVNGSDTLLQEAKRVAEGRFAADDPYRPKISAAQARMYR